MTILTTLASRGGGLISFTIEGQPRPKERPYFGNGKAFTREATKNWEDTVAGYAMVAIAGQEMLTGQLGVILRFRREKKHGADIDNLSKAVLDGMNKVIYKDDKQIMAMLQDISYDSAVPGVDVHIVPMAGFWDYVKGMAA